MRKKYSFILTILPNEDSERDLRGRLQFVSNQESRTFKGIHELEDLICKMVESETSSISGQSKPPDHS